MREINKPDTDPNYVPNLGRRKLFKRAGQVIAAMGATAGVYEFVTKVVPAITDTAHNILINAGLHESNDPEWYKHPTNKEIRDPSKANNTLITSLPANSIVLTYIDKNDSSGTRSFQFIVNYTNDDLSLSTSYSTQPGSGPIGPYNVLTETYLPNGPASDSWKELLNYKKNEWTSSSEFIDFLIIVYKDDNTINPGEGFPVIYQERD